VTREAGPISAGSVGSFLARLAVVVVIVHMREHRSVAQFAWSGSVPGLGSGLAGQRGRVAGKPGGEGL